MLKDLFRNRLFIGALAIFIFCVGGSLLYMQHVTQQGEKELAETQDRVAQWNERQNPTTEVSQAETPQGHFHEDGTWHGEPHETPVDRPVLPPLEAQEIPKFVKPVSDSQDVTVSEQVAASGDVPDRAELEAMSDEQLRELMDESLEKLQALAPEMYEKMREWAKVEGDLTRHAKTPAEHDEILAENAHLVQPLREAKKSAVWEFLIYQQTSHRASKILDARFFIAAPDFIDQESLTDEFWTAFWSDF